METQIYVIAIIDRESVWKDTLENLTRGFSRMVVRSWGQFYPQGGNVRRHFSLSKLGVTAGQHLVARGLGNC